MYNRPVVVIIVSLLLLAAVTTAEAAITATTVATSILSLSVMFLPVATALSVANKNHNDCHNNKIPSNSNERPTTTKLSLTATTGSSTTSTSTPIIPNYERAKILNSHLETLLLEFEPNAENNKNRSTNTAVLRDISSIDIMNAALRWAAAKTETKFATTNDPSTSNRNSNQNNSKYYITDPRFGRPALRTYHSFVVSDDRYDDDPILLEGLARKKAKQIHHMIQQRQSRQTRTPTATTKQQQSNNTYKKNDNNNNPPQHLRDKVAHSIAKGERRARERSNQRLRTVCSGCSRPFNLCLCEVLGLSNTNSNNTNANSTNTNTNTNSASSYQQHPNDNTNDSNSAGTTASATASLMTRSQIVVLQHPNEFRKKHTSTVPLLKLVLGPENLRVKVGYEFTQRDVLLWDENGSSSSSSSSDDDCFQRPIMLFPGPDAMDLDQYVLRLSNQQETKHDDNDSKNDNNGETREEEEEDKPTDSSSIRRRRSGPITTNEQTKKTINKTTLILIDGTWAEAKRILRKSPEILEACQMVQFAFDDNDDEISNNGGSRSIYNAMRREPEDHCLSTLEACGQAIEVLEGPEHGPKIQTHLLEVLSKHVELHLANAKEAAYAVRKNRDSTNKDLKLKRAKEIERAIFYANNDGVNNNSHNQYKSQTDDNDSSSTNRAKRKNIRPVRPIPTATTKTTITIADTPTRLLRLENDDAGNRKSSAATKTNDDAAVAVTVTIRRLTHEDIPTIDDWWENSSPSSSTNPKHQKSKSITTIARSIESDYGNNIGASLGIVDENDPTKLIACILRYESGPLGILHVQESHRGKGYGTALLKEATRILAEYHHQQRQGKEQERHDLECTAFIKDGNLASQHVFSKAGWTQENPNAKKGSGKRRANRKWIFPRRE